MATETSIRAAALAVFVVAWTVAHGAGASVAEPQIPGVSLVGDNAHARSETIKIGKSLVLDFPRDIKDVLVADPKTANAVIRSSRRAYIIGIATGETNIVFFDAEDIGAARGTDHGVGGLGIGHQHVLDVARKI